MNRAARITGPAVLLLVAAVSVVVALFVGGGADRALIADPGAVVRFGLPIARLVVDLSAAVTIGGLALAVIGLPNEGPAWNRAVDVGAAAAALWTVSAAVTTFFTFLSVTNAAVTVDAQFGESLNVFITGTDLGLAWVVTVLVAAAVTVLCFAVRGRGMVAVTAGVAMIGLVPLAQQGHASGTASHDAAVTALGLHLVGAALWVGGLVLLVLLRGVLAPGVVPVVVARYSSVALGCFVLVAVSGYASAQIRIGHWADLLTPYGALVLVKTGSLLAIGVLGAVHRRRAIRQLHGDPERSAPFWRLVVVELAVMGIASGFAAALGRTATPVDQVALSKTSDPTPAELLTDDPLPHAPGAWGWLAGWNVDLLWLMLVVLCAATYAAGVVRLRRRGEEWPVSRSVAAAIALLSLLLATSGSLHLYDRFLVSANVGAHVLLGLVVPALVWAAAPVVLIQRAVHPRDDGSTGVREWTALIVRSAPVRYLAQPFPSFVLLAAVWWAFFGTQALRWSTSDAIGRALLDVVFLLVGLLAVPTLLTPVAAGRVRPSVTAFGVRVVGGVLVAAGTVSLGIALQGPLGLVQASWFGAMGRTWGPDPLVDQARAGVVLVVAGVAFLVAVVVVGLVRLRAAGGPSGPFGGLDSATAAPATDTGSGSAAAAAAPAATAAGTTISTGPDRVRVGTDEAGASRASRPTAQRETDATGEADPA